MTIVRKLTVGISGVIVVLWLAAWLPVQLLPPSLHWLLFWFGGIFTILLIPAGLCLWWALKNSNSPVTSKEIE
jgi:hypothetical protein